MNEKFMYGGGSAVVIDVHASSNRIPTPRRYEGNEYASSNRIPTPRRYEGNETDGSEEDDFADVVPAIIPADDSEVDDELLDAPAAPAVDKHVEGLQVFPAKGINLIAHGWADTEAIIPDGSEPVDFDDADQHEQENISQPLFAADMPAADTITDVPDAPIVAADVSVEVVAKPVPATGKNFLPMSITPNFDAIPQGMKSLRRWLCWQLRFKSKPKKPNEKTKIPMTPKSGRLVFADVTNPENWLTFDEAISFYKRGLCTGIGFALTNEAPKLCCVDVDHCFNPDGSLTDEAQAVIALCGNSFVEKSQSGGGIHVWFVDMEFPGEHGRKKGGVEVYAFDRYIAITGVRVETSSEELLTVNGACRNVIAKFIDADVDKSSLFDKPARAADDKAATTFTCVGTNAPLSDDDRQLVEFLRSDKCKDRDPNIFNLFSGNIAEYFKAQGKPVDNSVADCDLMIKLLYYVGGAGYDADIGQRALKVFGKSELAKRGKWLDREDYRLRTLDAAFKIWVDSGRKSYKSEDGDTAAQIEKLKADLREVSGKLKAFDDQRDAALERLKNVSVFDSATCLSDDIIEATAFAKLYDQQALAKFKRDIKNYGFTHKDTVINSNDLRDCTNRKAEEIGSYRFDLEARATALQAQIDSLTFVAADDNLRGVIIPDTYTISDAGIGRVSGKKIIPICCRPVLITGKAFDVDSRKYKWILSYRDASKKWRRLPAQDGAVVFDTRKIVSLADSNMPVTTPNAAMLVQYLDAFRDVNERNLPITYVVSRGGWFERGGQEIFVDPRRSNVVTDDGKKVSVVIDSTSQFANALTTKGTLEEWRRAYEMAKSSPVARLMVAASVAPPLLKVLGERNFWVHVNAPTRAGKTTALLLGATAVGSEKIIRSFDATRNGLAGAAADVNDFVFAIDEKQVADQRISEQFGNLIYSLVNGLGRTKLKRDSTLMDVKEWRSIILSTGETEMTPDNATGGADTRLLPVNAPKKEKILPADTCKAIRHIVAENYGHVLHNVVDKIIEHKDDLRGIYDDFCDVYREAYPDMLDEYCRYVAVLTVSDGLLNSSMGVEKALPEATRWAKSIFPLIPTAAEIDDTAREKDFVLGFIAQKQRHFISKDNNFPQTPICGKFGDDEYVYIVTKAFHEACDDSRFNHKKVVADLIAAGFFTPADTVEEGRRSPRPCVKQRIGELKGVWCYRIKRDRL